MNQTFKANELVTVVTENRTPPNCDITLNIRPVKAENGSAEAVWQVDENFINGVGVAMGGYVASAADITMAYAISSLLESSESFFSINLQTTFHKPVAVGEAVVEAKVEKKGRKVAYLIAEVKQNGKLAATVHSSVMIINNEE
ncbi:PaaI family thioesterase [Evansella clarkii]|jgi:uncharacterized protein (TIGR00369 family)|uniref:PaaI family thioesterase n=1 Tax=Evansella clarkii TaxID=79879 RepID=UPI000996151E|nr:PaaI family thioesterase [Evansella clarkii]